MSAGDTGINPRLFDPARPRSKVLRSVREFAIGFYKEAELPAGSEVFVTEDEAREVIEGYRFRLADPPPEYAGTFDFEHVEGDGVNTGEVLLFDAPLWTEEEGPSNLTMKVRVTHRLSADRWSPKVLGFFVAEPGVNRTPERVEMWERWLNRPPPRPKKPPVEPNDAPGVVMPTKADFPDQDDRVPAVAYLMELLVAGGFERASTVGWPEARVFGRRFEDRWKPEDIAKSMNDYPFVFTLPPPEHYDTAGYTRMEIDSIEAYHVDLSLWTEEEGEADVFMSAHVARVGPTEWRPSFWSFGQ